MLCRKTTQFLPNLHPPARSTCVTPKGHECFYGLALMFRACRASKLREILSQTFLFRLLLVLLLAERTDFHQRRAFRDAPVALFLDLVEVVGALHSFGPIICSGRNHAVECFSASTSPRRLLPSLRVRAIFVEFSQLWSRCHAMVGGQRCHSISFLSSAVDTFRYLLCVPTNHVVGKADALSAPKAAWIGKTL